MKAMPGHSYPPVGGSSIVHAIVLAGGRGRLLHPLTADRPTSLLPVAGKPLIQHQLEALASVGVTDATVVAGHGAERLHAFLGDGRAWGVEVDTVLQEPLAGPGHALAMAGGPADLVLHADTWFAADVLRSLLDAPGPAAAWTRDPRARRNGTVRLQDGCLVAADEGAALAGAFRPSEGLFDHLTEGDQGLRDALQRSLDQQPWVAVEAAEHHRIDVLTPGDLLTLHARLLEEVVGGTEHPACHGPVLLGEGTTLAPGCVVQGPVVIGRDCSIGPNAVILSGTAVRNRVSVGAGAVVDGCSIGSNVQIGALAHLRASIVDNGVQIGPRAAVDASVLGADASLGAGAIVHEGGIIGRQGRVAAGRVVGSVPDGGQAV